MDINPVAINVWLLGAVVGYCLGNWPVGLAIALGLTLLGSILSTIANR